MTTISVLDVKDITTFKKLIQRFNQVFKNPERIGDDEHLNQLLQNDAFKVFAAVSDDAVIGGLTAYFLPQYYSNSISVYIYDVVVRPDHQRQQIGSKLLNVIKDHAKARGYHEVYVQTEAGDRNAISFYRANGGQQLNTAPFTF